MSNKFRKQLSYPLILSRLQTGATFLDVGCCFGQKLHYLHHEAEVPTKQLYAFDLEPAFKELGFELFRDRNRFGERIVAGNVLAPLSGALNAAVRALLGMERGCDVFCLTQVLHCWDWDDMLTAATNVVMSFCRPAPGVIVVGDQMGSVNPGSYAMPTAQGRHYRHDVETFRRFWGMVAERTGSKWEVEAGSSGSVAIRNNEKQGWMDDTMRILWFCCVRVG